jgi:hypothetical protein
VKYPFRDLAILTGVALAFRVLAALLVDAPPYTDAAYYTLVAERVATGHGFTIPVLYSFLEVGGQLPADPTLPVPSNAHWLPLTSIVAAAGMVLFGPDWRAGQVPMVLLSTGLVAVTHLFAWELWRQRRPAVIAALLAIFAGPLLVWFPLVDGFATFGMAGALSLFASVRALRADGPGRWIVAAGALVGLATLARIDGLLLALPVAVAWWTRRGGAVPAPGWLAVGAAAALVCLAVLAPWAARNVLVFGTPLPSTGGHTLWITSYNQQFTIGSEVSLDTFLASGPAAIIGSRLAAMGELAGRTLNLGGGLFALFGLGGVLLFRGRPEVRVFAWYWVAMFLAMSLVFTHHAPKGAFMHSASAWLPMGFAIAAGSVAPVSTALGRAWSFLRRPRTHGFLEVTSLIGAVVLSLASSGILLAQWRDSNTVLETAGRFIAESAERDDVVMHTDPARLYLLTGNRGVAPPFDPYAVVAEVVRAYDVDWLVVTLEGGETRDALGLWEGETATDVTGERPTFIDGPPVFEAPGVRIFEVTNAAD